jgi:hypothetical protein
LEQVLGDRPNVHAWFTNEDPGNKHQPTPPDDEMVSSEQESFMTSNEVEVIGCSNTSRSIDFGNDEIEFELGTSLRRKDSDSIFDSSDDEFNLKNSTATVARRNVSKTISSISDVTINDTNECNRQISATSDDASMESPKKKKKLETKAKLISPIQAKDIQKRLLQTHKRQIHEKGQKSKMSGFINSDLAEKDFIMKSRESKNRMESLRHQEMKKLQATRIKLDAKRCEIDEKRYQLEMDNSALNRERIRAQTQLDDQKRMLVKLEMFKLRTELKKDNPDISEEYLDRHFGTE